MRCQGCQGLMVVDRFVREGDDQDQGQLWLRAWRCVNCGEVLEPGLNRPRRPYLSAWLRLMARCCGKSPSLDEVVPLGV